MHYFKAALASTIACAFGMSLGITAFASSITTLSTSALNFTAVPSHFSSVDPKIQTYFLENGKPGKVIHESLLLSNPTAKQITINEFATTATNGTNGNIVYGMSPTKTWVSGLPSQVVLHAHQSKTIHFDIKVPAQANSGDHLFAISCSDGQVQHNQVHGSKSGIVLGISSTVRRVIAVQVDVPGHTFVKFDLTKVALGNYPSGQYYEVTGIDNSNVILEGINGTMTLFKGDNPVYKTALKGLSFSPGSPVKFLQRWVGGTAPIGDYHVTIALNGKQLNNYKKTLAFGITPKAVEHYAQLTGDSKAQVVTETPMWVWFGLGGLVAVVGILTFLLVKRRRRFGVS